MDAQRLLADLIAFPSITPNDEGCQEYMMAYLQQLGFNCLKIDDFPVCNFFARIGTEEPLLVFAGHTDVVPAGDTHAWNSNPFSLYEKEGKLYGRGTADMKGGLAAMMTAVKRFLEKNKHFSGSIGFLITSGEEGDCYDKGTPVVMEVLKKQGIKIDYCILGEPSSQYTVGDMIKIGRRGSLNGILELVGKQGHVAYPHLADNPIHNTLAALQELCQKTWDEGNNFFPPTSFQITRIASDTQSDNIIPGKLTVHFNFRFSTEQTENTLKEAVAACFEQYHLSPIIQWRLSGNPFLTAKGALLEASRQAILKTTGTLPILSTTGGTSDGRFIAPHGIEVIEIGLVNATIHQVNECILVDDLTTLENIYYGICHHLLEVEIP